MTDNLSDRTILLTDGTCGFGRVAAVNLAKRGATVAVVGRDESKRATLAEQSNDLGGDPIPEREDLEEAYVDEYSYNGEDVVWAFQNEKAKKFIEYREGL